MSSSLGVVKVLTVTPMSNVSGGIPAVLARNSDVSMETVIRGRGTPILSQHLKRSLRVLFQSSVFSAPVTVWHCRPYLGGDRSEHCESAPIISTSIRSFYIIGEVWEPVSYAMSP